METKFEATGAIHEKLLVDQGRVVAPLPPGYAELPKDIREELPPQEDLWTNAPGELIWRHLADPEQEALGMTGFSWQVRKIVPGVHEPKSEDSQEPYFQASTPYRAVFYSADTAEDALGCLLKGMCHLSREGAINPSNPLRPGAPPIQHVIHILTERLLQMVEHRQDHLVMSGYTPDPAHISAPELSAEHLKRPAPEELNEQLVRAVARDNEVISALATSIAALARVKDL